MAGSRKVNVLRVSATGVLLDPMSKLKDKQFVYASLAFDGGPSLAFTGYTLTSMASGIFIRWEHSDAKESARVDRMIGEHMAKIGKLPMAPLPPPPPPPAPAGVLTPAPAANIVSMPAPAPAAVPGAGAAGKDLVDVTAAIRRKAKRVLSKDLAARIEVVDVLSLGTIRTLIREAVDESVVLLGHRLNEDERRRVFEETEDGFRERLEAFAAEKAGLEEKTRLLQKQIERVQTLLEEERTRVLTASQFTVSDAGMMEMERRLERLLEWAMRKGQVTPELEKEMRSVVLKLLDDEREKIHRQAQEAQNDKISLLERKVQRLAESLQSAEVERDQARRRAQALEASGGVPLRNILEAGLDEGDPDKERKLSLLKEIVQFNRDVRKDLAAAGRLPKLRDPEEKVGQSPSTGSAPALPPEPELAKALGVQRKEPEGREAADPEGGGGSPAPEDTSKVAVLASGSEVDPDDRPWEAPGAGPMEVKIRRFGK